MAAAHHDAVVPAAGVKLLASPILAVRELDDALKDLLAHGRLRGSSNGWKVTARGQQGMRELLGFSED
ncbi:MAG: hypothetical protein ACR2JC_08555 [Chloroflexota bacterium]